MTHIRGDTSMGEGVCFMIHLHIKVDCLMFQLLKDLRDYESVSEIVKLIQLLINSETVKWKLAQW